MRFYSYVIIAAIAAINLPPSPAMAAPRSGFVPWTYNGINNGEDDWAGLSQDYAVCDLGTGQSPIDIDYTKRQKMPVLKLAYHPSKVHILRKDFTLVINFNDQNTLTDDGHEYRLIQMRMHTPGEHHILGKWWPLELQFIHRDSVNQLLILSVLAEHGVANAALQTIIDHAPGHDGIVNDADFDPAAFLPDKRGYYAYTGSLTSPPCAEGVEWRVLKQRTTISLEQSAGLAKFMGRNARLPQPVYMRVIKESID